MAIHFKPGIDVLGLLAKAGYSTYRLRKEKLLGESVLTKLRRGGLPSWNELSVICRLLQFQPGDLIEYIPEEEDGL